MIHRDMYKGFVQPNLAVGLVCVLILMRNLQVCTAECKSPASVDAASLTYFRRIGADD